MENGWDGTEGRGRKDHKNRGNSKGNGKDNYNENHNNGNRLKQEQVIIKIGRKIVKQVNRQDFRLRWTVVSSQISLINPKNYHNKDSQSNNLMQMGVSSSNIPKILSNNNQYTFYRLSGSQIQIVDSKSNESFVIDGSANLISVWGLDGQGDYYQQPLIPIDSSRRRGTGDHHLNKNSFWDHEAGEGQVFDSNSRIQAVKQSTINAIIHPSKLQQLQTYRRSLITIPTITNHHNIIAKVDSLINISELSFNNRIVRTNQIVMPNQIVIGNHMFRDYILPDKMRSTDLVLAPIISNMIDRRNRNTKESSKGIQSTISNNNHNIKQNISHNSHHKHNKLLYCINSFRATQTTSKNTVNSNGSHNIVDTINPNKKLFIPQNSNKNYPTLEISLSIFCIVGLIVAVQLKLLIKAIMGDNMSEGNDYQSGFMEKRGNGELQNQRGSIMNHSNKQYKSVSVGKQYQQQQFEREKQIINNINNNSNTINHPQTPPSPNPNIQPYPPYYIGPKILSTAHFSIYEGKWMTIQCTVYKIITINRNIIDLIEKLKKAMTIGGRGIVRRVYYWREEEGELMVVVEGQYRGFGDQGNIQNNIMKENIINKGKNNPIKVINQINKKQIDKLLKSFILILSSIDPQVSLPQQCVMLHENCLQIDPIPLLISNSLKSVQFQSNKLNRTQNILRQVCNVICVLITNNQWSEQLIHQINVDHGNIAAVCNNICMNIPCEQTNNSHIFLLLDFLSNMSSSIAVNDVIQSLVQSIQHPYLWSASQQVLFLTEFSEYIETHCQQSDITRLEQTAKKCQVISSGKWTDYLPSQLAEQASNNPLRKYNVYHFKQLIRFIRNKISHFQQLSKDVKNKLGGSREAMIVMVNICLPKMLSFAWMYAKKKKWKVKMPTNE